MDWLLPQLTAPQARPGDGWLLYNHADCVQRDWHQVAVSAQAPPPALLPGAAAAAARLAAPKRLLELACLTSLLFDLALSPAVVQQVLVAEGRGHAGLPDCGHWVRLAGDLVCSAC